MSATPQHIPLVVETRGVGSAQSIESVHYGSVAVVNTQGQLIASAGDAQALTFTRSTIKPFQALEFMELGGALAMGYSAEEIAMLCASHSGEDRHVALADSMLKKARCEEHHLQCGCHVPLRFSWFDKAPPARAKFDQRHNNCSGKHAGFLAYCRLTDTPTENYLDEGHPLQKAIRGRLARAAALEETRLVMGIDGCSAPNYALPLATLAKLYALLAQPQAAPEANASLHTLANAMRDHPLVISGDKRSDYRFVQAGQGDWLAKVGAGAVQTVAVRSAGLGLAIKIAGGNLQALYCATVAVLDQLGLLNETARGILHDYVRPPLINPRKIMTGEWRAIVNLQRAGQ
jgi:L-asparaginase II